MHSDAKTKTPNTPPTRSHGSTKNDTSTNPTNLKSKKHPNNPNPNNHATTPTVETAGYFYPTTPSPNAQHAKETKMNTPRTLVWFSAGAASAIAAKLTIAQNPPNLVIAYTDPGSEHPDNERFLTDCEKWFGHPIIRLKSKKYADTWAVFDHGYLVSPYGAMCTAELKKKVRRDFQLPDDIHVFGYTSEEQHRADRFREQNIEVDLRTPLIEYGLTKDDCLAMVSRAGIELPAMYKLGYRNNNCIGCVKGGMGYWNKIRKDFPDTFERMAQVERKLNISILRSESQSVFLDELDPTRGNHADEPTFECSLLCTIAEEDIELSTNTEY